MPRRREFLATTVASLTSLAALDLARPAAAFAEANASTWDMTWLDQLKGKNRQVFDCQSLEMPLLVVTNYLDASKEVYGYDYPDVNVVLGIAGKAFPINAGDALWAKYELGRRWNVKDPATGQFATKNIWLEGTKMRGKDVGVKPLMARGAIFWQCNNALNGITGEIATDTKQPFDQLKAELVAGLNPGVKVVIAHTYMIGQAQQHGCSYEMIG